MHVYLLRWVENTGSQKLEERERSQDKEPRYTEEILGIDKKVCGVEEKPFFFLLSV